MNINININDYINININDHYYSIQCMRCIIYMLTDASADWYINVMYVRRGMHR